jgi:hypothetical protein
MDNIMNYQSGSLFFGKELNYWCEEQMRTHGSQEAIARSIYLHFTFRDETLYRLVRNVGLKTISFERV